MSVGATCSCTTPLQAYIKKLKEGKSTDTSAGGQAAGSNSSAVGSTDLLSALSAEKDSSATKFSPSYLGGKLDVAG